VSWVRSTSANPSGRAVTSGRSWAFIQVIPDRSSSATKPAPARRPQQLDVVVTGEHVDRFEAQGVDGFDGARPHGGKRNRRDTGNDDGIAPPCSTPVRQYDTRN